MHNLPEGAFMHEVRSPENDLSIKIYLHSPALSANAIRGELVFLNTGEKPRNIYWCLYESSAEVEWLDTRTVLINGRKLDVHEDKYDWRNE